jgi:hypothetical protein
MQQLTLQDGVAQISKTWIRNMLRREYQKVGNHKQRKYQMGNQ